MLSGVRRFGCHGYSPSGLLEYGWIGQSARRPPAGRACGIRFPTAENPRRGISLVQTAEATWSAAGNRGLRYPQRVHIVGEVSPPEMPGYLRAVDAVLVPNFAEGLPNVCVEASACGRGVLASDVGSIPNVIVHGETGPILPPGDVRAWASALAVSSAQRDVLREMGRHGQIRVQHLFVAGLRDEATGSVPGRLEPIADWRGAIVRSPAESPAARPY
jgi:Glycosyl transferases group 1